jgi:prepilin-type N-terminal cleavage/methylation domain-containing protein
MNRNTGKKEYRKKETNKGFTLLEVLVAILLLALAVTGPMTIAQSSLRAAFFARDQVVALYLAQDAVETIKNIRDDTVLENIDKLSDPDPVFTVWYDDHFPLTTDQFNIGLDDSGNINIITCGSGDIDQELACNTMRLDSDEYYLVDGGADNSKYTRAVSIAKVTNDEYQITVAVEWSSSLFMTKRITVQENIYDWAEYLINI